MALNYQKLGKEFMTQDEIAVMDGGKCIFQLRGVRPFFSDKYDITQAPELQVPFRLRTRKTLLTSNAYPVHPSQCQAQRGLRCV